MHWALVDYMHVTLAFNDKFPSHGSLHPIARKTSVVKLATNC